MKPKKIRPRLSSILTLRKDSLIGFFGYFLNYYKKHTALSETMQDIFENIFQYCGPLKIIFRTMNRVFVIYDYYAVDGFFCLAFLLLIKGLRNNLLI